MIINVHSTNVFLFIVINHMDATSKNISQSQTRRKLLRGECPRENTAEPSENTPRDPPRNTRDQRDPQRRDGDHV